MCYAEQENKEAREVLAGGLGMPEGMKALKEQVCVNQLGWGRKRVEASHSKQQLRSIVAATAASAAAVE